MPHMLSPSEQKARERRIQRARDIQHTLDHLRERDTRSQRARTRAEGVRKPGERKEVRGS